MRHIAKQLYNICNYKDDLACSCNHKAIDVVKGERETIWIFEDGSTLSLDSYGGVKIDGKYTT